MASRDGGRGNDAWRRVAGSGGDRTSREVADARRAHRRLATPSPTRARSRNNSENTSRGPAAAFRESAFAPWRSLAGLLAAALLASACARGNLSAPPGCIPTHEEGCLSVEAYAERASALAESLRMQPNFPAQWGLGAIDAHQAYAHLALAEGQDIQPGEGQTIGILDTGIDQDNPLFADKTLTEEFLPGAEDETGDGFSHGTAVASILAGVPIPSVFHYPHGVAFGADLAVFAIPLGTAPEYYDPVTLEVLRSEDGEYADVFRQVLAWEDDRGRLDFLNLSFGYAGLIDSYAEAELRASYRETISALAQPDADEKTILVWAAGNAHGTKCNQDASWCIGVTDGEGTVDASTVDIDPGLPLHIEELRGHSLAVVATGPDGDIADFSNRCGSARAWCLAAPGDEVPVAYFGPYRSEPGFRGVFPFGGTSLAAPFVTGGLAVMKHVFRDQLSNTDLAARLLETADRTGRYADEAIYGRGLLDLGAATAPVGPTAIAMSATVNGPGTPLTATGLVSGGALGDAFAHSFQGHEIAAFDALGAPFWLDLRDLASERSDSSTSGHLDDFMAPDAGPYGLGTRPVVSLREERGTWGPEREAPYGLQLGLLDTPPHAEAGHLGLAEHALTLRLGGPGGLSMAAFSTEGTDGASPTSGALLSWRAKDMPLRLRTGWLAEREALLGTSARGAFGGLSADAAFAGVGVEADLGPWRLSGGAELGRVMAEPSGGMLEGLPVVTTSAFALRATLPVGSDRGFSLSVSQPLRVESGRATLVVPAGRTKGGDVVRRPLGSELSPTGRELNLAARWHRRWTEGGELRVGAVWTREPGHRATADPRLALLAGWRQAL